MLHDLMIFVKKTQSNKLDLNNDTLAQYKEIVDSIVASLYTTHGLEGFYLLLYTDSFFDALNIIQMY